MFQTQAHVSHVSQTHLLFHASVKQVCKIRVRFIEGKPDITEVQAGDISRHGNHNHMQNVSHTNRHREEKKTWKKIV